MHKAIVLSGIRDPDLVAIYHKIGSREFQRLTKEALRSVVRPGYRKEGHIDVGNLGFVGKDTSIRLDVWITAKKDTDVSEMLSRINDGQLGFFIKQAIRFYLGEDIILRAFLKTEYAETKERIFGSSSEFGSAEFAKVADQFMKMMGTLPKANVTSIDTQKENKTQEKEALKEERTVQIAAPVFPVETDNINLPESQETNTAQSDDDDVLALLEGLLG